MLGLLGGWGAQESSCTSCSPVARRTGRVRAVRRLWASCDVGMELCYCVARCPSEVRQGSPAHHCAASEAGEVRLLFLLGIVLPW